MDEEKRRIARRMERFDCQGRLHIVVRHENGNAIAAVQITHRQSHKMYVNIDLPEKWHTFINDNHRMGPAKVCRRSEWPLIQ